MELISSRYSVVDGFLIASQQNGTKVIIDHETCCLSLNKAEKDLISAKKLRDLSRYRKSKSKLVACESQLLFEIVTAAPQVFIQNSNYTREANKGNNTKYTQSLLVIPAFFFSDVKKVFFFSVRAVKGCSFKLATLQQHHSLRKERTCSLTWN